MHTGKKTHTQTHIKTHTAPPQALWKRLGWVHVGNSCLGEVTVDCYARLGRLSGRSPVRRFFYPSFISPSSLPSFLSFFLSVLRLFVRSFLCFLSIFPSLHPSFLPSFLPLFLPSFLHSFPPLFLPVRPSSLPSSLPLLLSSVLPGTRDGLWCHVKVKWFKLNQTT